MLVDHHAHLWTHDYLDRLERYGRADTSVQRHAIASMGERFALMERAGVDRQLISVVPQGPDFADAAHAVSAARHANDLYAAAVQQSGGRLGALAALPLPHADAALEELRRAFDELGAAGVAVNADRLGTLGPLYEELDRRGALLLVHPSGRLNVGGGALRWMLGAPVEDSVAALTLVREGVPQRFPRLRILVPHLGGALPMLARRIDHQSGEPLAEALRLLYYDTACFAHPPALRAAAETFGRDRLVLGTDFPFTPFLEEVACARPVVTACL
ncbi:amidohydrolase family protein [Nonomuraea typhae]|uniref:amidohydrolase family protein n=1 Tax=Nonomuraea typhae TaxID=2603600 RepID=UPI0012F8E75E|nr:amidohydrolase family protein [Nonomuraea typhae]